MGTPYGNFVWEMPPYTTGVAIYSAGQGLNTPTEVYTSKP